MVYKLIILAILLCAAGLCEATELKLPLLWTVNTNTLLESAPTLADLTGDGYCDVLAAGREEMIALDHNGKTLWRWRTQARYMTYPAVLSRKGQPALIYAADNGGLLTCLNGSGKVVWQVHLKTGSSWSSAVVCDLNHDGNFEVIQTDESGTIWAFDALTGKVRWQASMKGSPVSPAVGDVDGDGKDEIAVASTAGQLALFSSTGKLRWERTVSGASETWATSAPVIFGASDRHGRIVVGASDGYLRCFDSAGKLLWSRETRGSVASSLSVGDMDHAGRADIFAITQTGVIYRFGEDGREIWNIDMQGRTIAAGALIDLQNDGHLDFVTSTQSGHLMVFDSQGQMLFEHQFPNRTINMTPAFGDVTPSSPGLEMVINGGESGRVFCFVTPAAAASPSARPWVSYRGDNHKTGAWFGLAQSQASGTIPRRPARPSSVADRTQAQAGGMMPKDATWNHFVTGDPVVFTIHVPETQNLPLKATAACVRPDGSLQSAITPVYGAQGELPLPIDIVRPGSYRFSWWVADSQGRKLAEGQHTVSLEPFARDRALVQQALSKLTTVADRVAPTLPLAASGLRREVLLLQQQSREVEAAQKVLPGADGSTEQAALRQTAALIRTARRDAGLASAVDAAAALGSGTSLVAFETTLWESGGVDAQLPTQAVNPLQFTRRVVPGEHDPISVKLLNVTDRELQVRVLVETPSDGPVVVPFRSVVVPTSQGGMSWDALAELDETCTLSIPAFATREVWLDARFDNVSPGEHGVKVRFQALNGAGVLDGPTGAQDVPAPETVVELHYRVLPFAMVPDGAFRLCCWASYGPAEIADLLDHGNNVFCVPQGEPKYDAQSHLTGCDYTKLDKMLNLLRGHDVVALVQSKPELKPAEDSPQYAADLKTYLADLVAHFAKLGFDTDHFALYPYDEPGGNGWNAVNGLAVFGQQVKAANPKIKLYIDGGGELPMFQKVAPYIDIWCPGLGMLAEQSPEMDLIRGTHKALWSYDCGYGYTTAMRANLKDTNIVAEYRSAALFAVRWNATGIGFWCYNLGPDAWERVATDYPLVYPGKTKPVTSRRWEAVREGIEDARMLLALRQSEATIKDPALKERIRTLFDVRLPAFTDRSYHEVLVGLGRSAFSLSKNDAVLAAFRNEMLDCIEMVCQERASAITTAATRE
jgi:outer membrane protein assembly factor BamB